MKKKCPFRLIFERFRGILGIAILKNWNTPQPVCACRFVKLVRSLSESRTIFNDARVKKTLNKIQDALDSFYNGEKLVKKSLEASDENAKLSMDSRPLMKAIIEDTVGYDDTDLYNSKKNIMTDFDDVDISPKIYGSRNEYVFFKI